MSKCIYGNTVGVSSLPKSYLLETEDGAQLVGVLVGEETIFTADASTDIREGKVAATEAGVVTGTKRIPAYETTQSFRVILPGRNYSIPLSLYDRYDYTKLQCVIAKYDSDPAKRMAADKIVINDNVYAVNSSEVLSNVTKNFDTKSIDLNITNDTDHSYLIYYFTCKEEDL